MTNKISRNLNLVIPIYQGNLKLYAHHTPIDAEHFDRFFDVIGKTFAKIMGGGFGITAGPAIAAKMLRKVAEEEEVWDSTDPNAVTVRRGLMAEIRRLTNIVMPAENGGWELVPFDHCISVKSIDEDDVSEIENAIVFFSVNWHMHARQLRRIALEGAAELRLGQVTSSNAMEFRDSLPTSTPADPSTTKPA